MFSCCIVFHLYLGLTILKRRCYNARKFHMKAMRKKSTLVMRHSRERAMVKIPYAQPGEEPFQAQTESGSE